MLKHTFRGRVVGGLLQTDEPLDAFEGQQVSVTIENGVAHEGMIPSSEQEQEVEPPEWLDVEKEIYIPMPAPHVEILKDLRIIDGGPAKPSFILPDELPAEDDYDG